MTKKTEEVVEVVEVEAVVIEIAGLKKDEAIDKLVDTYGYKSAAAREYYEANKPARGTGFAARFYDSLRKGAMSDEDFAAFLKPESKNVRNHESHYNSIRELANDVRASLAVEVSE